MSEVLKNDNAGGLADWDSLKEVKYNDGAAQIERESVWELSLQDRAQKYLGLRSV